MGGKRLPPLTIPDDPAALGYLAGIIDGEGNIGISSSFREGKSKSVSHGLRVVVTNTDLRLMEWLDATFGGGMRQRRIRTDKWASAYSWTVHAHQAEQLLLAVLPYLVVKREQAMVGLKFREIGRGSWRGRALDPDVVVKREQFKQRLHILNERGPMKHDISRVA